MTYRGQYTPRPPEKPPADRSTGRHYRRTPEPANPPPAAPPPPEPESEPETGQQHRTATDTEDQNNQAENSEYLLVELRNQVVDRMRLMNVKHGHHAWERADTDPIAPHGIAFFYADHDPAPTGPYPWRICTATRLFLDGPESTHLPRLLWEQTRIADDYRLDGPLDPRVQLANRMEPMTEHARYFGVGVSTMDLPDTPWARQRQRLNGYEIIGRCFVLLADDTWLLLHRGLPGAFSALRIWSSRNLDNGSGMNLPRWNWGRHLPDLADVATRDIWIQLRALHRLLTAGNPPADQSGAGHGR